METLVPLLAANNARRECAKYYPRMLRPVPAFVISGVLLTLSPALAQPAAPAEESAGSFRGIPLGSPRERFDDLDDLETSNGMTCYQRKSDDRRVGREKVDEVRYCFEDDLRLVEGLIKFHGCASGEIFEQLCRENDAEITKPAEIGKPVCMNLPGGPTEAMGGLDDTSARCKDHRGWMRVTNTAVRELRRIVIVQATEAPTPSPIGPGDIDGDGFLDPVDKCPALPGTAEGCPDPWTHFDVRGESARSKAAVQFLPGSAALAAPGMAVLEEAVKILAASPAFEVRVTAAPDSAKDPPALATSRADASREYLLSRGVASDRVFAEAAKPGQLSAVEMSRESLRPRPVPSVRATATPVQATRPAPPGKARFPVKMPDGKFGYIDATGKLVIPARFARAGEFSEGLAAVGEKERGDVSYIDASGKVAFRTLFVEGGRFQEGLAVVTAANGKQGIIDRTGRVVVPPKYSRLGHSLEISHQTVDRSDLGGFVGGHIGFNDTTSYSWGYLDPTGREAIPARFSVARPFVDGLAAVSVSDAPYGKKWGYIDASGQFAHSERFDFAGDYADGVACAEIPAITTLQQPRGGFIDKAGHWVIRPAWFGCHPFSKGLAPVYFRPGYYGWKYVDRQGKDALGGLSFYHVARPFFDERAVVGVEGPERSVKYGAVTPEGRMAVPAMFKDPFTFRDGLAFVTLEAGNGQEYPQGYIDRDGRVVWGEKLQAAMATAVALQPTPVAASTGVEIDVPKTVLVPQNQCMACREACHDAFAKSGFKAGAWGVRDDCLEACLPLPDCPQAVLAQ